MRRALVFVTAGSLLFGITIATAANPPKPGTLCSKLGVTKISGNLKYTCIKSGKKLVWSRGVLVSKKAATPTPTVAPAPSNEPSTSPSHMPEPSTTPISSPSPKPISAGDFCNVMGDVVPNTLGILECRQVAYGVKKYFQLSGSIRDLPKQASPLPLEACRVPDLKKENSQLEPYATAYPITWPNAVKKETLKILFIPFDFSDHPGVETPASIYADDIVKLKDWVKWYSNGKKRIEVETVDKWIRASKPSTIYATYLNHDSENTRPGFEMILKDSENLFDYSNADVVFLIFPRDLKTFASESGRADFIQTNKGRLSLRTYSTGIRLYYGRSELWFWLTHELLHHAWGIQQHAPAFPPFLNISTGTPGPGQSIIAWDQMILDWANPEDIWCEDINNLTTAEVTLVPMEREQEGVRAAMIKLAPSKVLVVESHRRDRWGKFNPGTYGLTAYIVDTRFATDRSGEYRGVDDFKGVLYTRAANFIEFNLNHPPYMMEWFNNETGESYGVLQRFSMNYFLFEGESFTFENVTVKFLRSGDNDTIEITKSS